MNRYSQYVKRIMLPKSDAPFELTPSICFMGGGNLWTFAIGVGHFIFRTYPLENLRFLASSSGCFAAVPLACGMDPYEWCKADWHLKSTEFCNMDINTCYTDLDKCSKIGMSLGGCVYIYNIYIYVYTHRPRQVLENRHVPGRVRPTLVMRVE